MDKMFLEIAGAVEEGDEDLTVELTEQALEQGRDPIGIIQEAYSKGVEICGRKYNEGIYFLPELMLTGEVLKAGLALILPKLEQGMGEKAHGKAFLGTVEGDVHDIGKNICLSMLLANGFEIIDGGVDNSPEQFLEAVAKHDPDIVGLGSYMSTTLPAMEDSLKAIKDSPWNGPVIVGGVAVNPTWARQIGSDGYAEDAWECVALCKSLMNVA